MERKLKNSKHTVERMHQAMVVLLSEKSFEKISVVDIAKKAGINRTTFYLFYGSKEELLMEMYNSFLDEYMEMFKQELEYNETVDVSSYQRGFKIVSENERMLKAVWNVHVPGYEPYFVMKSAIENAVKEYLEKNELGVKHGGTADFFALLFSANVMALVEWWMHNYKDYDASFIEQVIVSHSNKGLLHLLEKQEKRSTYVE